jgi:hypothetical protein
LPDKLLRVEIPNQGIFFENWKHGVRRYIFSQAFPIEIKFLGINLMGTQLLIQVKGDKKFYEGLYNIKPSGILEVKHKDLKIRALLDDTFSGLIYWKKNDSTYEGELKSGEITGLGSKEFPDGRLELGEYNKDKFDGCGVTQSSQKTVEYGVYTQGVKN